MQEQFKPQSTSTEHWQERESGGVNLHKIVGAALSNLPWFVGAVVVSLIVAFLYLRYATPIYQIHAQIMIKDEKNEGLSDAAVLQDLGLQSDEKNINNEITILGSRQLMTQVVRELKLNIHYTVPGRVAQTELYGTTPFEVDMPEAVYDSINGTHIYKVKRDGSDGFVLTYNKNEVKGRWNDTLELPRLGKAVFVKTARPFLQKDEEYTIVLTSVDKAANKFLKGLTVVNTNKQSAIIDLTIKDEIPKRGEAVLNKLIEVYQQANIDDKNETANNTMDFIDNRLAIVNKELTGVEKEIADYKKENKITDAANESMILLQTASEYNSQLTEAEVQLSVLESLQQYIEDNKYNNKVIPASLVAQGTTFANLIGSYNDLRKKRAELLLTTTENNPMVVSLDKELDNMKQDLKISMASVKRDLEARIGALRKKEGFMGDQVGQIPNKERVYLEYSREQAVKQEIYLFLLKKREETAIGKSTTIANSRIIEPARSAGGPYTPIRSMVFLSALLIGIVIPSLVIYIKNLLNTRIENREDIVGETSLSIAGEIGHNDGAETLIVLPGSRSVIAEQFRALRTNVEFLMPASQEGKVLMITSSMSGEGKSFISLNLASTLALSGKKVVLMELDLRKPKISKYLGLDNSIGFSNYAIGQLEYDKLMIPSGVMDNFFIIPSGPIPPNPSELITMQSIVDLFARLKKDFDYVVIDTAPIGFVTDAQLLSRYTDAVLYLVRQRYTYKQQIQFADELYRTHKMPRMSVIVNDVKVSRGYGYGYGYGYYSYGYGYGYGYGNGYFENGNGKPKKNGLNKILNRFSKTVKKD